MNYDLDSPHWITGNGEKIKPCDMDYNHLINVKNFLERNKEKLKEIETESAIKFSTIVGAELASKHAEDYLMELSRQTPKEWLENRKIYKLIQEEIEERKGGTA